MGEYWNSRWDVHSDIYSDIWETQDLDALLGCIDDDKVYEADELDAQAERDAIDAACRQEGV